MHELSLIKPLSVKLVLLNCAGFNSVRILFYSVNSFEEIFNRVKVLCTLSPKFSHVFRICQNLSCTEHHGGSKLPKHLKKCLLQMWKMQKIEPNPKKIYDGRKFRRKCVNVIDTTCDCIYFLMCENFSWEFRTQFARIWVLWYLKPNTVLKFIIQPYIFSSWKKPHKLAFNANKQTSYAWDYCGQ